MKYTFLYKMKALIRVLNYAKNIYERNSSPNERYYELCLQFARLTEMTLKGIIGAYIMIALLVTGPAMVEYLLTGHMVPSMHAYFVGVTEYSEYLESLLNLYNHSAVVVVLFTFVAPDILIYMTFANIPLISRVVEGEVDHFEEKIQLNSFVASEAKGWIIEVIRLYGEYIE